MDTLLRLAWALPLVLLTGAALMLVMKRFMPAQTSAPQAPVLLKTLRLSEHTQAFVIDIEGAQYLLVESQCNALLEAVPGKAGKAGQAAPAVNPWQMRLNRRWARR
jgi:predicted exporter